MKKIQEDKIVELIDKCIDVVRYADHGIELTSHLLNLTELIKKLRELDLIEKTESPLLDKLSKVCEEADNAVENVEELEPYKLHELHRKDVEDYLYLYHYKGLPEAEKFLMGVKNINFIPSLLYSLEKTEISTIKAMFGDDFMTEEQFADLKFNAIASINYFLSVANKE